MPTTQTPAVAELKKRTVLFSTSPIIYTEMSSSWLSHS